MPVSPAPRYRMAMTQDFETIEPRRADDFPVSAIGHKSIIEVLREPDTYGSGLIVRPERYQYHLKIGRVVATGPGGWEDGHGWLLPPAEVGDIVLFLGAWQGDDLPLEIGDAGRAYRVLDAYQIAAVVEGEADEIREKLEISYE